GMLVAVNFADPVRECGEPVVVVAIKDDPRGVGDSALAHQLFEGGAGWNVAADRIAELGGPVEADRPLDVASLVSGGVHVDLQESDLGVLEMVVDPLGGYERRRVGVVGWHAHHALPFPAAIAITLRRPWSPVIRGNRRSGTYLGPPAVTWQWSGRRMTPIPRVNSSTRELALPCKRLPNWDPCGVLRRTQAAEKHPGLRERPAIGVAAHLAE